MAKNIYALLVGIDNYDPNSEPTVPSLSGCINDIRAAEAYLRKQTQDGEWQLIEPTDPAWILTNQAATRQAIIDGFKQHLCNAGSDDVVFFYYSGHGGQEKAPEEFWQIEPDRLQETLVCYDSRTKNSRDLADKELAYLISKIAKKNPHVVIILDCCHSGSGTKDPLISVRCAPIDPRDRPLSSLIFAEETSVLNELSSRSLEKKKTGLILPQGRHVLLSACRDYELAREYRGEDGQPRGAFSYFLLKLLQQMNSHLTYRDLARNLNAVVSAKIRDQSPQIEATDSEELDKLFLGGAVADRPFYFTLNYSRNENSWVIDGGALQGIPKLSNTGETRLAIFPVGVTSEELRQISQALGEVQVMQVMQQRSKVAIIEGNDRLSENETYWAILTNLPVKPLKVFIKSDPGEEVGTELILNKLDRSNSENSPSLYLTKVENPTEANYHLLVRQGQYWITLPTSDRPLVARIPENPERTGYTLEHAFQVIQKLEHIARWTNIIELSSPVTSRIKPDDVEMEIAVFSGQPKSDYLQGTEKAVASEMCLEYTYANGEWQPPQIQIKLKNHSQKTLYCNVLKLAADYSVSVTFFDIRSSIRLSPKVSNDSEIVEGFDDIMLTIPPEWLAQSITEYKDIFKLIVSTAEFDASLLEQDRLDPPADSRQAKIYQGNFNSLIQGNSLRKNAIRGGRTYEDWMVKEVSITILRPQDAKAINQNKSICLLEGAVEIQPHPTLQAKANLTTVAQVSRDLGNLTVPPILLQDSSVIQPFQFTASRGSDPGLSALELTDVENYAVVTSENPLKLLVNVELEEGEHLLPIGYDGEFFLPLGRGLRIQNAKTEIRLERLPSPTVSSRSLQGSIRIFFQKVVSKKLGHSFEYPILAAATVTKDGAVIYDRVQENFKARVAQAQRILLYIHGIIGDTESMLPSVQHAKVEVDGQQRPICEVYDLVLAFDYENINTTIEQNAKLLGQRLEEVGLGHNHGKQLHIVAHSMGGLVSRWFIEREGGNQVVQHLIMLGTPNAGSPWPAIQNWAFTALTFGLNQFSTIIWPTRVVAELLDFLEANDYSLDEMQADSAFIKEIAENPDPQVPYTIIAGDRALVPAALQVQPEEQSSLLQRLLNKLFANAVDRAVALAFFEQPNDIAVTLASIKSVNANRSPQPKILQPDAGCDHLTYFTTKAGFETLAIALTSALSREILPPPEILPSGLSLESQPVTVLPTDTRDLEVVPNSPTISASNASENAIASNAPSKSNQSKRGIWVVSTVALLIFGGILGFLFWKPSPPKQPATPKNTSYYFLPNRTKV